MDVSIGVMAYNEEENIGQVLDALTKQKTKKINIKEIIVVDDGSTDRTGEIVLNKKNKRIKLLRNKKRSGKWVAINKFLKNCKQKILVLESADNIPRNDAIEKLCLHLFNSRIGAVASRIVPVNNKQTFFGKLNHVIYDLHHIMSLRKPKFGELIAFRKAIKEIARTNVDEEEIASCMHRKGFLLKYKPGAVVYNKGPETIQEYIRQRRRHYCGHLQLKERTGHSTSTMKSSSLIWILAGYNLRNWKNTGIILLAVILEVYIRLLGWIDYRMRKDYSVWRVAATTKKLNSLKK